VHCEWIANQLISVVSGTCNRFIRMSRLRKAGNENIEIGMAVICTSIVPLGGQVFESQKNVNSVLGSKRISFYAGFMRFPVIFLADTQR
jgi:hypothetical protein